ncbi:bifunctional UDP-N-acetylglucosamine diphosphorylase/glucosamine-1-phosphate N-acetyltransferase GlmU [Octadecabacter sp. 1_MG-2023]|uniref:bifunctional UDP-N-acetylglucosamine diphosphorylase/glucosamine-1-phosphate N-acetyltransferase GlmU n=1 Tax=unclassified Octadecabacter TaxID=196158 RepID=UPI001C0A5C94|nr:MULTISPECIES: bifunctional UDP-N-acetylglucosamine diphosphorylase/glucosamine-1-phosphate N-acetyltransferase GlmU [unclassified Octadecabacter]MBU2993830.1 bifunctional UDP-N-acetylglucosamine diphosphorylase/glucosamine-1-phosphate N-acetyltransferase GlmU [Octadecabacter sp. B2R22]MDO6735324.1 bifunctional UDP-N-acetylglucosamine diphosphorylase/glucosamine-1-phosphate N-acetyltransferase GlmU [Octadecabacter sp. 1_MG-2023]
MAVALIILAAGKGSRMKSDLPKVLHKIAGAPLLVHAMKSGASLEPEKTIVVTGHGAELVEAAARDWSDDAQVVLQSEQLGTGHAVLQAQDALDGFEGDAIVLYGDTPFIQPETLEAMIAARAENDVVVLGFDAADPGRYGRLVMKGDALDAIVEYKDADDATRAITLCNSGVICAKSDVLFDLLDKVTDDNAAGEYYLTDIIGIARAQELSATVVRCDEAETMGINSRAELAVAEVAFQTRARSDAMENGVTLQAPDTVYFSHDTYIGTDAIVEPNVVFAVGVTVENNATIRAFSHLEGCHVSRDSVVGPYARLRPGAELAEGVKIGNFVEIKNAYLDAGSKVNHLSYIGDAQVGERTNIGAGTITCNYDGVFKHKTTIGADVFVGSNTMLVAPVTLGDESMTATGTVVTRDVPDGDLAVGRARQENKAGFARRMFEKLKSKKAKAAKET